MGEINTVEVSFLALESAVLIWRRLWIPGNLKLSKLDRVIQQAFGWANSHLHEFKIAGERYGMREIESMDGDDDQKDDKKFAIDKVCTGPQVTVIIAPAGTLSSQANDWPHFTLRRASRRCPKIARCRTALWR